jgi:hypothetical protein
MYFHANKKKMKRRSGKMSKKKMRKRSGKMSKKEKEEKI